MGKKSKFWDWFDRFMHGVTFFHIAGLALMFFGGQWGEKARFNNYGFNFPFTLAELAGFITFFRELAKSWLNRRKATVQGQAGDAP
ncbi:MAG: hypothetical protein OHK0011_19450 [Turneriella sp.]